MIERCNSSSWYPGQGARFEKGGRPPVYSQHQKEEVARVAMELKRGLYQPTPRRVRQRLPQASRNRITNRPMSDSSVIRIFQTKCYDEGEDDPWQYLPCLAQDVLPAEVKPLRVGAAKHILANSTARSWHSHVAIDPCYTLLPKTQERLEEQRVAAMGKMRWRSCTMLSQCCLCHCKMSFSEW